MPKEKDLPPKLIDFKTRARFWCVQRQECPEFETFLAYVQKGDIDGVQNTIGTVPDLTLRNNIALRLAEANGFADIERLIEATLQQREEQSKANKESRSMAVI